MKLTIIKKSLIAIALVLTASAGILRAQIVNIPDTAFLLPLLFNSSINTNADGYIQVSEANAYSGSIIVNSMGITDLTGIEAFTGIDTLECAMNNIGNLVLSNNPNLTFIDCSDNQLFNLDVFSCTSLLKLVCINNQLDYLDLSNNLLLQDLRIDNNLLNVMVISNNTALSFFSCDGNGLSTLDVSNNTSLNYLQCNNNQLSSLDVSTNTMLVDLRCSGNQLVSLDVSMCTLLNYLDCSYNSIASLNLNSNTLLAYLNCGSNQLSNLDLTANSSMGDLRCFGNMLNTLDVSNMPLLYGLHATGNSITSIDLSVNSLLNFIDCSNNLLTGLNIQNGNNLNLTFFSAIGNTGLTCIQVDDANYMNTNWISAKDTGASYSLNCALCVVNIPDVNFKNALLNNSLINTNANGVIECSEAQNYTGTISVNTSNISDLTGIEAFVNITTLECFSNNLSTLNLSANTALTILECGSNQLTALDLSSNTNLVSVNCANNSISSLTTLPPGLQYLYCENNQLSSLDLSSQSGLIVLHCYGNQLQSLNIQNGNNYNIFSFYAYTNPLLSCIQVDDALYMSSNFSGNVDTSASFSTNCGVCIVAIPDVNFKSVLLANVALNTNANNEIECSEASAYYGFLNVANESIADLTGIEAFVNIDSLDCNENNLVTMDISALTNLVYLNCEYNSLIAIDVSSNSLLQELNCGSNNIPSLNLSDNPSLLYLDCRSNNISSLDVSNCSGLYFLNCRTNQITDLDLHWNSALTSVECYSNQLSTLNIQNGNNVNLTTFDATNNPNLTCVQVDNVIFMNNNFFSAIDAGASYSTACAGCIVSIPDANFKAALVANPLINTNLNSEIECAEAAAYNGSIDVNGLSILNVQGIEAFTALTAFDCSDNLLANLDLSTNTSLTYLDCSGNEITSLNLSFNTALIDLYCNSNQLIALDVSANTALENLNCSVNLLTNLDVSNCANLYYLNCIYNQLNTLLVSANPYLNTLLCTGNQLNGINLSSCNALSYFYCHENQLTTIDLTSCPNLVGFHGHQNQLSFLDVSTNTNLSQLDVSYNALNYLNMQNGNNTSLTYLDLTNNPNLTCIQVDDVTFMNANFLSNIDTIASFSTACAACVVTIPDANFKAALVANSSINTNANTEIECSEAAAYTGTLLINNAGISDLTGIAAFVNLTNLFCFGNQIASLDVSALTQLDYINCSDNLITTLNVSGCSNLTKLYLTNNPISNLDVSSNLLLEDLQASNITLDTVDVSANTLLKYLNVSGNNLQTLDVSNNTNLLQLVCNGNQLMSLDLSNNTLLNNFHCENNQLTYLDLSFNPALTVVNCHFNLLQSLNLQNGFNNLLSTFNAFSNPNLTCIQVDDVAFMNTNFAASIDTGAYYSTSCAACTVSIPDTNFKNALLANTLLNTNADNEIQCSEAIAYTGFLDVSNSNIADITGIDAFVNLTGFDCSYNQLTYFYLNIPTLTTLNCSHNNLYNHLVYCASDLHLDISYNLFTSVSYSELATFNCSNNLITSMDVTACPNLTALNCANNSITAADLSNNGILTQINCSNNALSSLIIQNGNNSNLSYFSAVNNPNLACIQVDNTNFMNSTWPGGKDATADYSSNCAGNTCQSIPVALNAASTTLNAVPLTASFSNATANASNYQFVWYFGDGTYEQNNASSISHTYAFNGVYSVALLAIDTLTGCTDTLFLPNYITCNASGAVSCNQSVSLNPSGIINACAGSPVPLSGSTSLNSYTMQWNRNGVMLGGASQDQYIAVLPGNYSLTVIDAQGCPVTSSPVQINYSLPGSIAPVISASGPAVSCGTVNVTLSATGNFTNYLWSNGQSGSSITVTQGGSYTVTGQSPACDAVSFPYTINASAAPVPPICMVTVDENDNKNVVIWEKPQTAAIDSFMVLREDVATPGIYEIMGSVSYVDLSEYKDLSSDADARAYRYKLAVKDTCGGLTIPSLAQRSMHLDVSQGNSVLSRQLTWNVYQGQQQSFDYYLIYRETAPGNLNMALLDSVPSAQTWYTDNSLTNLSDTLRGYKVTYRVSSPCVSTRAVSDECSSNVARKALLDGVYEQAAEQSQWAIVPNPNQGLFYIRALASGSTVIKIYSVLGELVHEAHMSGKELSLDLSAVPTGVYVVQLNVAGNVSSKRLVISK